MRALAALLILAVAAPVAAQDKEEKKQVKQEKMDWTTDYKAALKTAEKDGKLVIVHFWADW